MSLPRLVSSLVLLPLFCLAGTAGAATLYRCTDTAGSVLFTNQKPPGRSCTVLSHQPDAPTPAASGTASAAPRQRAAANPTPGDFPRVSGDQQKARDGDRRAILDKELATEQKNLATAKKALADAGGAVPERVTPLRDAVQLHERNIEALTKEIGKLR